MKRTALKKKTPLVRKTPLKRGEKALAAISDRRKPIQAQYVRQRKAYLQRNWSCMICIRATSMDVHHKKGRAGKNLLDEDTWMALCRKCHDWIHANPKEATEKGWMQNR